MPTTTEFAAGSFGLSRAKGSQRPDSAIDLAIVAPDLGERQLLAIETRLDELSLPYTIDFSLLHAIRNPMLVKHVQRAGSPFYFAAF
jgi:hypothetical protein